VHPTVDPVPLSGGGRMADPCKPPALIGVGGFLFGDFFDTMSPSLSEISRRARRFEEPTIQPQPEIDSSPFRAVVLPSLFLLVAMFNLTLCVAGLKELIIDDLGGTAAHASWFFSIESLAYIIFAPIWGLVSDRYRRRRLLIVTGFLVSGLIYVVYLKIDSLGLLLFLRFVQGAFSVMAWSTLMALVLDQPDEKKRGRYMGLMGAALIFGVSLGAPVGGYLSRYAGVRAPLAIAGILFLLLAFGSLLLSETTEKRGRIQIRAILDNLKSRPRLLLPYLFQFVDRYTVGLFLVIFPLYLGTLGVDDPATRGRYLGAFLLPFALLQYFTGKLSERTGPMLPLLAGSALYGVVLCLVGFSDLQDLYLVMAALGVLASVMFPPAMFLTAKWSDSESRGSAMGGFNLAGSLGFAIGPLCGWWIFERAGFQAAFIASGLLELFSVLVALALMRHLRFS
jgi:MFS transporter, DHA1 family, tetracycline resistance protein